ncbi:MAG: MAE_28990/MAE_18760 family HEPN-like nuclease [Cytophagales bacterium]
MNLRITNQISSINSLFKTGENIKDEEIQAHFAKYLCVKSSGLLENYIKSQVGDYVDTCSSRPVATHVKNKMKTFTNIDYDKLTKFLDSFNPDWTATFNRKMNDELKSSLNTLISNRNNIAHGNQDSISFGNMKTHYETIKEVIKILDEIIKK